MNSDITNKKIINPQDYAPKSEDACLIFDIESIVNLTHYRRKERSERGEGSDAKSNGPKELWHTKPGQEHKVNIIDKTSENDIKALTINTTTNQALSIDFKVLQSLTSSEAKAQYLTNIGIYDPLVFLQPSTTTNGRNFAYIDGNRLKPYKPEDGLSFSNKLNKFGNIYPEKRPPLLHEIFADIVVNASKIFFKKTIELDEKGFGYHIKVYETLYTVNENIMMHQTALDSAIKHLIEPRESAHERGMAIHCIAMNNRNRDFERYNQTDAEIIHRDYTGDKINQEQRQMRLLLEQSFQKAAYKNGIIILPEPKRHWEFSLAKDLEQDSLHIMLASLARCTGQQPPKKDKVKDWNNFENAWNNLNKEGALNKFFEVENAKCPEKKKMQNYCYTSYKPIYTDDFKNLERFEGITNSGPFIG